MRFLSLGVMMAALCGCGAEREPATTVGVLWGPAPSDPPASSQAASDTPLVGPNPDVPMIRYDVCLLSAPLETFIAGGLIRPGQQALVLSDERLTDFIAKQHPGVVQNQLFGASGDAASSQVRAQFAFISDYTFDAQDAPQPEIAVLNLGSSTCIQGHAGDSQVVLDRFDYRATQVTAVVTEIGRYPRHGVLLEYPWEEPNCLLSDALLAPTPITLSDSSCVVVPCHYWTDRPSPSAHSRMIDCAPAGGSARSGRDGVGSWPKNTLQQVVIIQAHCLRPGTLVSQTVPLTSRQRAATDLTPPWHHQQGPISSQ